jgi:oligoribonuclease NrnB/cAMP/cGMP phosphodiesterase (DHH superfamily)
MGRIIVSQKLHTNPAKERITKMTTQHQLPIVVYHDNCPDGFAAAYCAWLKFKENATYLPCQYEQIKTVEDLNKLPLDPEGKTIYILDFSFPKEVMLYLLKTAKKVIQLDHHKTSLEILEEIRSQHNLSFTHNIDTEHSGAILAWNYFHNLSAPDLFYYIDDYDRWRFQYPKSKPVNKALYAIQPWTFEQWERIVNESKYLRQLIENGRILVNAHAINVKKIVESATMPCEMSPSVKGLAANCPPMFSSDVGHELAVRSGTFGMAWSLNKDGVCICQLRSNGNYDVSAIAKQLGGGGHLNAAGFSTPLTQLMQWIKQ